MGSRWFAYSCLDAQVSQCRLLWQNRSARFAMIYQQSYLAPKTTAAYAMSITFKCTVKGSKCKAERLFSVCSVNDLIENLWDFQTYFHESLIT